MTPWRLFYHLLKARMDASSSGAPPFNAAADWTTTHDEEKMYIHYQAGGGGSNYEESFFAFRGERIAGWEALSGADYLMKVFVWAEILPAEYDTIPCTYYKFVTGALDDPPGAADEPDYSYLSGRYYKTPAVEWPAFPPDYDWSYAGYTRNIPPGDLPCVERLVIPAWDAVVDNFIALPWSDEILKNGAVVAEYGHGGAAAAGEGYTVDIKLQRCEVHYMNPITNSFSRYEMPAAGGPPLVLTGLGFDNADAEIEEGGHHRAGGWDDRVDYIYIKDFEGATVATLRLILGDYTIDSNEQITILSWPALPKGVYSLYLRKEEAGYDIYGYAGDWRTDASGRMRAGERLYIAVGGEKASVPLWRWRWRKGGDYIYRYVAPIDVRATAVFYDGLLLSASSFTRGTNDRNGLPLFPDLEVELDNSTREYSELLAEYWCKNQPVEVYTCFHVAAEALKELRFRGIVVDYDKPGSTWRVRLRDILAKYFELRLPQYRCSVAEFPSIHPNHIGREMPEAVGLCEYAEGTTPGAVEAVYVDTSLFKYLALRGPARSILAVYADGVLVAPADYAILYADGGRTYIVFDADRGEAKITFDCEGYSYEDWNWGGSAGGYVRNPAYVILFVLAFFLGIPEADVDLDSFDALAAEYAALGEDDAAYIVIQDEKEASQVLQELLFTSGAKMWVAADGRITIGRKDVTELTPEAYLFQQIDALEEAKKPSGFSEACNYAPVRWRHYPTANLFVGSKVAERASSIAAFEAEIMPSQAFDFPWTASETLADLRAEEELLKLGFGDQRLQLRVSMEHASEIDILSTFRFQDPWGISLTGAGDVGRYFYVEKLTFDLMENKLDIEAIDFQWVLRQYLLLGDEGAIASNWSAASEADRMWAYLCDETTWEFADGEPGKLLIDENW